MPNSIQQTQLPNQKPANLYEAVVSGQICLDMIPDFGNQTVTDLRDVLSPGKAAILQGMTISSGGCVPNTGRALHRLGIPTRLNGLVGEDYFGRILLEIFQKDDLADGIDSTDQAPNSFPIVISPPGIDRMFLHDPGVNCFFHSTHVDFDAAKQARLFHFGYPTAMERICQDDGDALVEIFATIRASGVITSMDTAMPDPNNESDRRDWRRILTRVLPLVDVFTPSLEELFQMLHPSDYSALFFQSRGRDMLEVIDPALIHQMGQELMDMQVKIALIKCGTKGMYVRTQKAALLVDLTRQLSLDPLNWAGRELMSNIFEIDPVVSTNGSGDSSIAGFLASLLRARSIEQSLDNACAVGALCVQTDDAVSGLKSLIETEQLIQNGWKKRITSPHAYWGYNEEKRIWTGRQDRLS